MSDIIRIFRGRREDLDVLCSREPENWAEWAGFARDPYTAKREPFPGDGAPKPPKPINDDQGLK